MARPARPMAEDTRRVLLDEAARAFIADGYEAASLNTVLGAAGVGKSSFYHRFRDKQGLFAAVAEDRLGVLAVHVQLPDPATLDVGGFWPAVDGLLADLTHASRADARTVEAGRLLHLADAPDVDMIRRTREQLATWGDAMLTRGRELECVDARVPPDLQRALAVSVAVEVDRWSLVRGADARDHRVVADVLRRLLAPRAG